MLAPTALETTKCLVRLILQRERSGNKDAPASREQVPAELNRQLEAVPRKALLNSIRRHRLECLLHGEPLVAQLVPDLAPTIQALARQEAMAALALASLTREIARLFQQADIPMLVIKGIPLALQTTGSLIARGRGDLDLLVEPRQLPAAVALLESAGFSRCLGQFPRHLDSLWGRYSRWASYEFSLNRGTRGGVQWIDLHWALSNVRAPLPAFDLSWGRGEQIDLNGQSVMTLNRIDAFQHACAHAARDQWMCLRNLIDIDRLANQLEDLNLTKLHKQPFVRWSCAVTHAATGSEASQPRQRGLGYGATRAILKANHTQAMPWRSQGWGPWKPQRWASTVCWQLLLSRNGYDWIRLLLFFSLHPATFSDPVTGEDRDLAGFLLARILRLKQRFQEMRPSNPEAIPSYQAEDSMQRVEKARTRSAAPVRSKSAGR